ncbi:MAG TPA: hypothetical protein VM223_01505 [Planctomycetota bacterium]|nr:hypothetical protein [Planctomycetota bacterium]
MSSAIGTMGERSLHAALKRWYADPGDRFEVTVDGFQVDIVRGDLLIEIQTRSFGALKRKLAALLEHRRVRLVYPLPVEKWIVRLADDGLCVVSRRRSTRHGKLEDVFIELASLAKLLGNPALQLEVLLTREEELRRYSKCGSWRRRGWGRCDRRLIEVVRRVKLHSPEDLRCFVPDDLPEPFSVAELAAAGPYARPIAGRIAYCLRHMGIIEPTGKRGNAILYRER